MIFFQEEDEWREFEEEKKDYTGLKIGNLTVNEHAETETDEDRGTGENSSDGETREPRTKQSGPWKKPDQPQQPEPVEQAPQAPAPAAAGGGSYKPPHFRNVTMGSSNPRTRFRNVAPDINSEEYFPTLSSSGPPGGERR